MSDSVWRTRPPWKVPMMLSARSMTERGGPAGSPRSVSSPGAVVLSGICRVWCRLNRRADLDLPVRFDRRLERVGLLAPHHDDVRTGLGMLRIHARERDE